MSLGGIFDSRGAVGPATTTTNTQTTNTQNVDARSVTDNRNYASTTNTATTSTWGSGNIGATSDFGNTEIGSRNTTNTTTNITTTDQGAIAAGARIAAEAIAGNGSTVGAVLDLTKYLVGQSQKTLDANVQLTGQLAKGADAAYADATAQATGNKSLILVAIAVVGVVGFMAFYKHH